MTGTLMEIARTVVTNHAFAEIAISAITVDTVAQIRANGTDPQVVGDYAEAMEQGATFPPVVLFHDGAAYFAGDGFHRIAAADTIGRAAVLADVRQGTRRDAILFAVGANADHGLRRSQADRRNAVLTLLRDPEWSRLSDRKIAEMARVDHKTVAKIRRELTGEIPTAAFAAHAPAVGNSPLPVVAGASMVERLLRTVSDEALVAEAARRGMELRR